MIKMLTAVASDKFAVSPGETTDKFSKAEEDRFIAAGLAERHTEKTAKKVTKKAK